MASNRNVGGSFVTYKECMRDYYTMCGRNALDGCDKFVPGPEEATYMALLCATCGCHKRFHRRDPSIQDELFSDSRGFYPLFAPHRLLVPFAMQANPLRPVGINHVSRHPASSSSQPSHPPPSHPSNDKQSEVLGEEETEEETKKDQSPKAKRVLGSTKAKDV